MSASDAISVQTDDGAATSFSGNLCSGYTIHSVMVVITVNPKIFGGIGGTEEVLPHVEIFTVPLQSPTTRPIRLIFYVRLGSSVSSSKMVGRQKRSSVACTGCSRRLEKSKTSLQCNRCVSPNVTGVIRLQAAAKHHRCTTNRNNHQHLATSHVMHTRKKWTVRQQNHQALETMRTPASACE
ncbi:hypothetical protein IGI04_028252 [Brassica rapa subsp. trilocularis]|nr:hypothetical protein IGI04_028252 [Brassica rapa subsp. trilocularis]